MEREKIRIRGARLRAMRNTESSASRSWIVTEWKRSAKTRRMWRVSPYGCSGYESNPVSGLIGPGIAMRISASTMAPR
jgi:hypothetical protein